MLSFAVAMKFRFLIFLFLSFILYCPSPKAEWSALGQLSAGFRGATSPTLSDASGVFGEELQIKFENQSPFSFRANLNSISEFYFREKDPASAPTSSDSSSEFFPTGSRVAFGGKEVLVQWRREPYVVAAGLLSFAPGGSGFLNPWNPINAKDRNFAEETLTLPSPGLQLEWRGLTNRVQVGFVAQRFEDRLPGANSSWWPRHINFPLNTSDPEVILPERPNYFLQEPKDDENALKSNVFASFHCSVASVEAEINFFEGQFGGPALYPTLTGQLISSTPVQVIQLDRDIFITPIYQRSRTAGLLLQKEAWGSVWLLQALQTQYIDDSSNKGVTTVHTSMERLFEWHKVSGLGIVEFSKSWRPETSELAAITDLFGETLLLGAKLQFKEIYSLTPGYLRHFASGVDLVQMTLDRRWSQRLITSLKVFALSGPEKSLGGIYQKNSYAQFLAKWNF